MTDTTPTEGQQDTCGFCRAPITWHFDADETECEGHESLRGDLMGATDFCDGSCRTPRYGVWVKTDTGHDACPGPADGDADDFDGLTHAPESDLDTESSGSRQHYIETGRYLTRAEHLEANPQA